MWPRVASGTVWSCCCVAFIETLTLIWMARGVQYVTPETLKRYSSKWPEVKFFFLYLYFTKCIRIISLKGFFSKKCWFRQIFNKKVRPSTCLWWCFWAFWPTGSSYMTHRHRWALIHYFVISLPLVTIVSQWWLVSLSIWIVSNE